MNKLAYQEPHESLNNRISAHSRFSDFDLHQWISSNFGIKQGDSIFDVGCGNGNYIELFLDKIKEDGSIYGVDKNEELINEAIAKYGKYDNVYFDVGDYDSIKDVNKTFDWIFSVYSLYYTSDSNALIEKLKNLLSPGGKLIVIGPASNNAIDLGDLNFKITDAVFPIEHKQRTERVEAEFFPLFQEMFGKDNTKLELVDSVMTFPSIDDFTTYYWSTLLWRESVANFDLDRVNSLQSKAIEILSSYDNYTIKKQMSCLVGVNSEIL